MLVRHFYLSEIARETTTLDIEVILGEAQITNRRLDLTGILVQSDGHFAQVLEGRADAVTAMVERLRADRRHCHMRTLLNEPIQTRQFARWAMALSRRPDLSQVLREAFERGCASAREARALMDLLMPL